MIKHLPNILTLGRLALTIVFLVMILLSPQVSKDNYSLWLDSAFVLFVVAGITDILDGKIARKYNVTSKFGRMVDPLADKLLICGGFLCFAIIAKPAMFDWNKRTLAIVHWTVFAVIIAREGFVTYLRHRAEAKGVNFAATASGKLKMFLQSFAIGTVLIKTAHVPNALWANWFTVITFAVMLGLTVFSGVRSLSRPR